MILKKCLRCFSLILLVAAIIVVSLPNQLKVNAEDYPEEILFPISILDFRADNLFFEYSPNNGTFANLKFPDGRGFVEDNLVSDPDSIYYGLPEYKEALVKNLALEVQWELDDNQSWHNAAVLNTPYINNYGVNLLSLRNYLGNKQGYVVLNAVDTKYKDDYKGAGNTSGLKINNYYTELGNGAHARAATGSLRSGLVGDTTNIVENLGGPDRGYIIFHYYNEYGKGNFDIDVYAATWENRDYTVSVNGTPYNVRFNGNGNSWDRAPKDPVVMKDVPLNAGDNTIMFSKGDSDWAPNLDRIEISSNTNEIILGNYNDSKTKYNIDRVIYPSGDLPAQGASSDKISDYGWYDIRTCYDYAYFITANLFKSHPSLNTSYDAYNNLRFHKVEDANAGAGAEPYYEFAGDKKHTSDEYGLIYNPDNKSIRNGTDADVKAGQGEFRTQAGQMFIADGVNREFPDIDKFLGSSQKDANGKAIEHNFLYTVHTHSQFVYKANTGQDFYFNGDDDVYVFINNQLLIDLGGAHQQQNASFTLDDLANDPNFQINNGEVVNFDFFYIERHSVDSNFYAKMNFRLKSDTITLKWPPEIDGMKQREIPYGYVVDLNYAFSSERELTVNKNLTFTDNLGNTIGAEGFNLGPGIEIKKNDQGNYCMTAKVFRAGSTNPEIKEFLFQNNNTFTNQEIDDVKNYFMGIELNKGDSLEIDGVIYDTSIKPFNDYNDTDDAKVHKMLFEPKAKYTMYMTMGVNSVNNVVGVDNEITIKPTQTVLIRMGDFKVSIKVDVQGDEYDARKNLYAYGEFTIKRLDSDTEVYKNEFNIADKTKTNILFTAKAGADNSTIYRDALPKGKYQLNMDLSYLTGYDLSVEVIVKKPNDTDETKLDLVIPKDEVVYDKVTGEAYDFNNLVVDFSPEIVNEHWEYPEVEYILKAVRKVNPLKDLT